MYKRKNRLVKSIRFNNSYSIFAPQFILKEKKNGLIVNRFGIIVSNKVDKRAVIRNKIKRFFRTYLADLDKKMSKGHDILFITRKEILTKTKQENKLSIENSLEKAGLIKI